MTAGVVLFVGSLAMAGVALRDVSAANPEPARVVWEVLVPYSLWIAFAVAVWVTITDRRDHGSRAGAATAGRALAGRFVDFGAPVIGSLLVVTVAMLLTGGVKNVDDTSRTGVFWAAWLGVAPILPMLMLARAPGRSDRILWFVGGTGVATSAALVSIVLGLGVPLGDLPGTASLPIWGVAAVMIVLPCYMRGRRRSATRPRLRDLGPALSRRLDGPWLAFACVLPLMATTGETTAYGALLAVVWAAWRHGDRAWPAVAAICALFVLEIRLGAFTTPGGIVTVPVLVAAGWLVRASPERLAALAAARLRLLDAVAIASLTVLSVRLPPIPTVVPAWSPQLTLVVLYALVLTRHLTGPALAALVAVVSLAVLLPEALALVAFWLDVWAPLTRYAEFERVMRDFVVVAPGLSIATILGLFLVELGHRRWDGARARLRRLGRSGASYSYHQVVSWLLGIVALGLFLNARTDWGAGSPVGSALAPFAYDGPLVSTGTACALLALAGATVARADGSWPSVRYRHLVLVGLALAVLQFIQWRLAAAGVELPDLPVPVLDGTIRIGLGLPHVLELAGLLIVGAGYVVLGFCVATSLGGARVSLSRSAPHVRVVETDASRGVPPAWTASPVARAVDTRSQAGSRSLLEALIGPFWCRIAVATLVLAVLYNILIPFAPALGEAFRVDTPFQTDGAGGN